MTTQFDFTNNEWSDVAALPVLVGLAVAKAADSGIVGSYFEMRTLVQRIGAEAPTGPAQSLIQAVSTIDVKEKVEQFESEDTALLADVAVTSCREMAKVIADKAEPAEVTGYLQWVLSIGREVADAARESGTRVSEPEADLLARIGEALGFTRHDAD